MTTPTKTRFVHSQRMTIVSGILTIVVLIAILQLWLFTATVNAVLGGDGSFTWPALFVSLGCLALDLGLLRYLYRLG